VGGRKSPFPITLAIGLYNSLYYRTSRDCLLYSVYRKLEWTTVSKPVIHNLTLKNTQCKQTSCSILTHGRITVIYTCKMFVLILVERVRQRVTYKLAILTHKVRTTATPTYLSELVQTRAPPRALRSSDAPMLVVPRVHTELARRAFSVAAPSTWNSLPADIRLCENILTFKRHLKTHLFKLT